MTRRTFIERTLRQYYGDQPSDDAGVTPGLVNTWINEAVGEAVKAAYIDNVKLDGVGYVNGAFYTTFKALEVTEDERFLYKVSLPELPMGLGASGGISTLKFKGEGQVSLPCIPLSQAQKGYFGSLRPIANKILFYSEGRDLFAVSTLPLYDYTAQVTMISGGDSSDLDSELNVPSDYMKFVSEYVKAQLAGQKMAPQDTANDGKDNR
jgi:hypothetical protein